MLNIKALVSDASCYEKIRELRWPNGVCCPRCDSPAVIKRGKDDKQKERQRYECKTCSSRFDDLTGTILEGHHQPLKTWVLCLYFMGLNLSNQQIAAELDLNKDDVQSMTSQLREGLVKKNAGGYRVKLNAMRSLSWQATKGIPARCSTQAGKVGVDG
jgi:transposase-like protein